MPRPTERRKTRRVPVQSADQRSTLRPTTRITAESDAGRAARELADALGVTSKIFNSELDRRFQKAALEGTRAAIEGREPTEDELRRDSFKLGFERVRTERSLVDTRRAVEEAYAGFDKTGTPEELNELIDGVFKSQYSGLDPEDDIDRQLMDGILGGLEQIRTEINTRHADDITQLQAEQIEGDLIVIARDDYEMDGEVDYAGLNERLRETVGGTRGNDILVSIVTDLAITNGRPDLIEKLPATWEDGTPSPRNVKRFTDALRNARIQAENQRLHNERLADAQDVEELKARRQQAESEIMLGILSGRETTGSVAALMEQGVLLPNAARTLLNFQESFSDDLSSGTVNDAASAELEVGLYTGDMTITDVIEAASEGRLGNGRAMRDELSRLMRLAGSVQTVAEQRLGTPEAKRYQSEIKSLLTPNKDAFGNPDAIELQTQAEALRVYDARVAKGENPAVVRNEVLQAAASRRQAAESVQRSTQQDSPADLLRQLEAGEISDAEFDRRMSAIEAAL